MDKKTFIQIEIPEGMDIDFQNEFLEIMNEAPEYSEENKGAIGQVYEMFWQRIGAFTYSSKFAQSFPIDSRYSPELKKHILKAASEFRHLVNLYRVQKEYEKGRKDDLGSSRLSNELRFRTPEEIHAAKKVEEWGKRQDEIKQRREEKEKKRVQRKRNIAGQMSGLNALLNRESEPEPEPEPETPKVEKKIGEGMESLRSLIGK